MRPAVRAGQRVEVDLAGQRLALGVQLEDLPAPGAERRVDGDLAVETAGPQERGVEDVGPVGGRDDDHAVGGLEAVHLDQQLVERLLALVVAAADARAAVPADRVDLVDEDDRRRPLLGLAEEIADAARADADEHLDEVRSRDREERHIGFPRDRAREQRLARAGRAEEQHALGDACADGLEAARRSQERGDLAKFLDRLLSAGDVRERRLRRVRRSFARRRAPEALERTRATAGRPAPEQEPGAADDDDEDQERYGALKPCGSARLDVDVDLRRSQLVDDLGAHTAADSRPRRRDRPCPRPGCCCHAFPAPRA